MDAQTRQAVQSVAKMQECRDTARRLTGNTYRGTVEIYMAAILARKAERGIGGMAAALEMMKERQTVAKIMWVSAAVVELSEAQKL